MLALRKHNQSHSPTSPLSCTTLDSRPCTTSVPDDTLMTTYPTPQSMMRQIARANPAAHAQTTYCCRDLACPYTPSAQLETAESGRQMPALTAATQPLRSRFQRTCRQHQGAPQIRIRASRGARFSVALLGPFLGPKRGTQKHFSSWGDAGMSPLSGPN